MREIVIRTIPHGTQRYDTAGDYWTDDDGVEQIRVTDLGDWRYELLVAVHELIEDFLCQHRGIEEETISAFDRSVLAEAPENTDPGMLSEAPYHNEHVFATAIEMLVAQQLGVAWGEYDQNFEKLKYGEY